MATRIRIRRDSSENWEAANPVLLEGEMGFDRDKNVVRIGDGVLPWEELEDLHGDLPQEALDQLNNAVLDAQQASSDAEDASSAALDAATRAEAVGTTNDEVIAGRIADPESLASAQLATFVSNEIETLTLKVVAVTKDEYASLQELDPTVLYLIKAPEGQWVEVARNYCVNPRGVAPLGDAFYWWPGTSNNATMASSTNASWSTSGVCATLTYDSIGNAGSGFIGVRPVTGGGLFQVSERWTITFKLRASKGITFAPPQLSGGGTVTMIARSHTSFFEVEAEEIAQVWMTVEFTSAPDSTSSLVVGQRLLSAGLTVSIADVDIYPGNFDLDRKFFSGKSTYQGEGFPSSPVIGDWKYRYAGAEDASESIRDEWQAI